MAERRMFAKTITESDSFCEMPLSAQALYFHLCMLADDEGFLNSAKKTARWIGATDKDLDILIDRKFILPFKSGVIVIKHWKINNYIQNDRRKQTVYLEEKAMIREKENHAYTMDTECIQNDGDLDTQDSIIEDSIEEIRVDCQAVLDLYHEICKSYPIVKKLSEDRKRAIKARLKTYSLEDFREVFTKAELSAFLKGGNNRNWSANFDWLIKDANMAKVLDGNYDKEVKATGNKVAQQLDESYRMITEWGNDDGGDSDVESWG